MKYKMINTYLIELLYKYKLLEKLNVLLLPILFIIIRIEIDISKKKYFIILIIHIKEV